MIAIPLVSLSHAVDSTPAAQEILVASHSAASLPIDHLAIEGQQLTGIRFRLVADRRPGTGDISLKVHLNRRRAGSVILMGERFPSLDLNTTRVEESRSGELVVHVRYGNPRPGCFGNDDGRDRVAVHFVPRLPPRIYPTTFEICDDPS